VDPGLGCYLSPAGCKQAKRRVPGGGDEATAGSQILNRIIAIVFGGSQLRFE
jgi:hypothetical protein